MNNLSIIGRLASDIDFRDANGTAVARFSLAVPRAYKTDKQPETDFFRVTAFGNSAVFLDKYFAKGQRIAITGHMQQDRYKDKDGNNRENVVIIVDRAEFCENKSDGGSKKASGPSGNDGFDAIPDGLEEEGLPFN